MDKQKLSKRVFFLAVFILLCLIFVPGYIKLAALKKENRAMREEIKRVEQNNKELNEEIKMLDGDKEYLEKVAREKLGLTKEGEIIYKVVEE